MYDIDKELFKEEYWNKVEERFTSKLGLSLKELSEVKGYCTVERDTIIADILNDNFHWGIPKKASLDKVGTNKKRIVYIFSLKERVVSGVLYQILSNYFANRISKYCFSYKKGVSTIQAVRHLRKDDIGNTYGIKLDISSYFNSVSKERIDNMLSEIFNGIEDSCISKVVRELYNINRIEEKGIIKEEFMSLIPGTAISSFFANYCLREVDMYFEARGIAYARYSDDIIILGKSEEELKGYVKYIKDKLSEYGLIINENKYEYFKPHDSIEFLGLSFTDKEIDIHKKSFIILKKRIKKICKEGRKRIERGVPCEDAVRSVIKRFNYSVYKCYVEDKSKYGWAYYAFRYVNTDKTIRQIDYYLRDRLRWLYTGKNNSANIKKLPLEKLEEMGYVKMTMMYNLFKMDFDVYMDKVALL